jgi:hypothetical protein
MSPAEDPTLPHRATILVGYGAFGRDVLRRLLASTALRGVLVWEEPHGGADPSERSLQDLALLWVRDRMGFDGQEVDEESAQEGTSLEMMRDLYRQIQQVPETGSPETDFADAIAVAAEKLLSASTRASRQSVLPLGLDVIVLARPTGPEVIGSLDRLLARGMERLANNANLERAVQGSEALNFVEILDFENYWDRGDRGRRVREAVRNSIEQWWKRRNDGKPGFGRFYLVDGRTADGIRDARHRMDETCLFLEFLLFEGQRGGDLQKLYQSQGALESPVATFGIRLMERSAGLLSRLAAAQFGVGWLAYLSENGASAPGAEPLALRQKLAPYRPQELDGMLGRDALRAEVDRELAALESGLISLPIGLEDWPERVRRSYEQTVARLEIRLTESVRERMAAIAQERLAGLSADLRAGVEGDLHDPRSPVPLGTVLTEVQSAIETLGRIEEPPPSSGSAAPLLRRIAELHDEFRRFSQDRVSPEGLRRWWPWLGAALSAVLTPLVVEVLEDIPKPSSMRFLQTRFWDLLQKIDTPLVIGLLLFLAAWGLAAWTLQRSIAARIERARRFYDDAERGRFVDCLREGFAPGGALRAPIDHLLDRLVRDMAISVRAEVRRELSRTASRLRERRREMLWLREQLRDFLRLHGLTADERHTDLERSLRDGTGIRHAVERGEDFDRMLRSNPPNPERFRSTQATNGPFDSWDWRYSRAFLYPLSFVDRLSRIYKDPFQQELALPGTGPEQQKRSSELLDFLQHHGSFSLAFQWKAQQGVPPDRRYCLMPAIWRQLPGVLPALSGLRVGEEAVFLGLDVARAYLLRVQTGVEPECLLETS